MSRRRRSGLTARRGRRRSASVQGPTELLPVSSSAHLSLVPWFAGWEVDRLDPEAAQELRDRPARRHRGGAADRPAAPDRRRAGGLRRAAAPRWSRSRSCRRRSPAMRSSARSSAGSAARARSPPGSSPGRWRWSLADRRPQERGPGDAGAVDGLALGLAQAAALIPGVSRNGATLTAARGARFTREHANLLSRTVALPVIVGATAAQGRAPAPPRRLARSSAARSAPASAPRSPRPSPRSA